MSEIAYFSVDTQVVYHPGLPNGQLPLRLSKGCRPLGYAQDKSYRGTAPRDLTDRDILDACGQTLSGFGARVKYVKFATIGELLDLGVAQVDYEPTPKAVVLSQDPWFDPNVPTTWGSPR